MTSRAVKSDLAKEGLLRWECAISALTTFESMMTKVWWVSVCLQFRTARLTREVLLHTTEGRAQLAMVRSHMYPFLVLRCTVALDALSFSTLKSMAARVMVVFSLTVMPTSLELEPLMESMLFTATMPSMVPLSRRISMEEFLSVARAILLKSQADALAVVEPVGEDVFCEDALIESAVAEVALLYVCKVYFVEGAVSEADGVEVFDALLF